MLTAQKAVECENHPSLVVEEDKPIEKENLSVKRSSLGTPKERLAPLFGFLCIFLIVILRKKILE